MSAHCCIFGNQVTVKRKEKRQRNAFLFVPIKCKCMLFPYEHHTGFVEYCVLEFKMQQSIERNCSSGSQTLKKKKKIGIKSKYMCRKKISSSTHILEIKPILFQTISKQCPAYLPPAFSQ